MSELHAAYRFLKATAFHDIPLPRQIQLERKPLRKVWGYYYKKPVRIEIASEIKTLDRLLRVMAHEMCHAAIDQGGACDTHDHGEAFKALASVVCERMGWSQKGF